MSRNSFKDLEELQTKEFESKSDSVLQKIEGETSVFRYMGDIIDLYFSKVMSVFVAMSGGNDNEPDKKE